MRETLCIIEKFGISQALCAGNCQLRLQLTIRSARNAKELLKLTSTQSSLAFGNVAWD
jgi:hypothetical protein